MATGSWPNIVDVASRTNPDGDIPVIAEMMSQHNSVAGDMPYKEANEMTGHQFVFRTSIPTGAWRSYNQGTPYGKSTTAKARVGMGMLRGYSQIDRDLANHTGNAQRFRETEDMAFLEGMGQTVTKTLWYGNTSTDPNQFMGLAPFYNTINAATAQNAANVIDGGGSGSSNASMWLIGWGLQSIYAIYPRGSKAGLNMEDKGSIVPAYDSVGNRFEAWTTWFGQDIGVVPEDWRFAVRIANLDTTAGAVGLAGASPPDLFALMANAIMLPPDTNMQLSGIEGTDAPQDDSRKQWCWYTNRTVRYWMDIQSIRNRNVLLTDKDYAGNPITSWRGIQVDLSDQLLITEAAVV